MSPVPSRAAGHDAAAGVEAVAIVGSGSIGVAWAVTFASAGFRVRVFESAPERRRPAAREIETTLDGLEQAGMLTASAAVAAALVSFHPTLAETLEGAGYVQECIGEDLEDKRRMFALLDEAAAEHVVLASSSSTIPASLFADTLPGRDRCLVVHPGNPPYFLRVAEVVPAPFTSSAAKDVATRLLEASGIAPIVINAEIEGFVFNRLQGALLREAYCLVRDGIVAPGDIDTLVREGLGLRWSVLGPFTTSELNTRGGLRRHAAVLGPVYARFGIERAAEDPWTPETVDRVADAVEEALPHDTWEENVRERDRAMMQVLSARRGLENPLHSGVPLATAGIE